MRTHAAFEGALNSSCNVYVLRFQKPLPQVVTVMCKHCAFIGALNRKCNV